MVLNLSSVEATPEGLTGSSSLWAVPDQSTRLSELGPVNTSAVHRR